MTQLNVKSLIITVLICFCLVISFWAPDRAYAKAQQPIILIYGDSLSTAYGMASESGWVHLLKQRLKSKYRQWQVVNLSISGQTTSGGLVKFEPALKTHQPALVVIELGGNDGLRAVPVPVIQKNLKKMVLLAKKYDAIPILLGMNLPSNYGPFYTKAFEKVYVTLKDQHQVPWVPSFLAPLANRRDLFQADGIHPTQEAQPLLLNQVWPVLEAQIKAY